MPSANGELSPGEFSLAWPNGLRCFQALTCDFEQPARDPVCPLAATRALVASLAEGASLENSTHPLDPTKVHSGGEDDLDLVLPCDPSSSSVNLQPLTSGVHCDSLHRVPAEGLSCDEALSQAHSSLQQQVCPSQGKRWGLFRGSPSLSFHRQRHTAVCTAMRWRGALISCTCLGRRPPLARFCSLCDAVMPSASPRAHRPDRSPPDRSPPDCLGGPQWVLNGPQCASNRLVRLGLSMISPPFGFI